MATMPNAGTIKFFRIIFTSKMDAKCPSQERIHCLCTISQDVISQQTITSIFTAVRNVLAINTE